MCIRRLSRLLKNLLECDSKSNHSFEKLLSRVFGIIYDQFFI